MIIFKELILENFGPYLGKNVINLVPKTEKNIDAPIILFGGINGGGKTTLMDSIRLALYGKRAECSNRDGITYKDFLLQCINKQTSGAEKTRIELTFEHIIDNRWLELKIVRYWDRNVTDIGDNLGIIEGDFPDIELTNNWDEYIEKLLPLGISNLFLFDGEQVKELAEQDYPTTGVKNAIKSLLGIELVEKLGLDLDILATRKQKFINENESKNDTFNQIENDLVNLETQKKNLIEQIEVQERKIKKTQRNYRKIAENLKDSTLKLSAELQEFKRKKQVLELKIETIQSELHTLASQYLPLNFIPNLLTDLEKELKSHNQIINLKNSQDLWIEKDRDLLDFLSTLNIESQIYNQVNSYLQEKQQTIINELKSKNLYLPVEENSLSNLSNILEKYLPQQTVKLDNLLTNLQKLEQELEYTELELARINSPSYHKQIEAEYRQQEKLLIEEKSTIEVFKKNLDALHQKINTLRNKLTRDSEDDLYNQQVKHMLQTMPKVKNTLRLFQEKLTLRKLNKLELEVTNCFRYLLHKSNFISKVAIATDSFALNLYDEEGDIIPKQRLSAGEKQILAISLLWGLARVSERNLPVAIDTPLGRLDSSHRFNLIERYFPTASHQVILLSTDTEIGKSEVEFLRNKNVISQEYLLEYDRTYNQTTIKKGYFWKKN